MLRRSPSETSSGLRSGRDTVIAPTPALAATSAMVERPSPRPRRRAGAAEVNLSLAMVGLPYFPLSPSRACAFEPTLAPPAHLSKLWTSYSVYRHHVDISCRHVLALDTA